LLVGGAGRGASGLSGAAGVPWARAPRARRPGGSDNVSALS